jgi:ferric enterobactin receptor
LSSIANTINSDHKFHFHNVDASLNYKKTFKTEDQELDLTVNTSLRNRSVLDNIYQYDLPQDSLYYSTKGNNPGTENETEFRADYTQPIKKNVILGVGSKLSLYDINSNSGVLKLNNSGDYNKDDNLSNILNYQSLVYGFNVVACNYL